MSRPRRSPRPSGPRPRAVPLALVALASAAIGCDDGITAPEPCTSPPSVIEAAAVQGIPPAAVHTAVRDGLDRLAASLPASRNVEDL